ncbi:MAG: hypothetical protein Q9216_000698 [Gyalolechia sp. 2 TL-2023]
MTTVATEPISLEDEETGWNEEQIELALGRLQEMHIQLRHLRDAIPRLLDPMLVHQPSPGDLYAIFASNVTTIRSDVKDFANVFRGGKCQEILAKARESRTQCNEDIRGWRVTEHEDWLDVHHVDSPRKFGADEAKGSDPDAVQRIAVSPERLRMLVEAFQTSNPDIDVSLDEDTRLIKVSLPPQAYTHFEVNEQQSRAIGPGYNVTTTEKTSMHAAIVKAINSNEHINNIDHLFVGVTISLEGIC